MSDELKKIKDKTRTDAEIQALIDSSLHAESHNIASHNDTAITGLQLTNTFTQTATNTSELVTHGGEIDDNTTHREDNTQAHSDYLRNDVADVGVGLTLTGDNPSTDTAYVPMVLYGTDATPPPASNYPIGTIYISYTA